MTPYDNLKSQGACVGNDLLSLMVIEFFMHKQFRWLEWRAISLSFTNAQAAMTCVLTMFPGCHDV